MEAENGRKGRRSWCLDGAARPPEGWRGNLTAREAAAIGRVGPPGAARSVFRPMDGFLFAADVLYGPRVWG